MSTQSPVAGGRPWTALRAVWQLATLILVVAWPCAGQEGQVASTRPIVGVALGGGSARGLAYVGVLRWFEQHRIPIDRIAGVSMGGLVGGAYSAGMSPAEMEELIQRTDWEALFGGSTYPFRTVARKEDARVYPARFELHLDGGLSLPPALNNGQRVDLLLGRIAGAYADLPSFDSLPTPFRALATDLRTGTLVVLESGSLPLAMRATMSIPGVFSPVHLDQSVLVDGGAMNNLPADVVRSMGADVVVAVGVGDWEGTVDAGTDLLSVTEQTLTAVIRANTRQAAAHADLVVHVARDFSGSDWGQGEELVEDGYLATEALRDKLLPYALEEAEWQHYLEHRARRRRSRAPLITRLEVRGASPEDELVIRRRLRMHPGQHLDVARLETDITRLGNSDRYTALRWETAPEEQGSVLVITAQPLVTAPPFLMTALNVRKGAAEDYSFQLGFRYLQFGFPLPRSQLRVDLSLATDPSVGAELRQPIPGTRLFAVAAAVAQRRTLDFFRSDDAIAQYQESRVFGQVDLGLVHSHFSETRLGVRTGYFSGTLEIGDPALPETSGATTEVRLHTVYDAQDHPVVPSAGLRLVGAARYVLNGPESDHPPTDGSSSDLMQAEVTGSHFWSWERSTRRVFIVGAGGTSFDGEPQFFDDFRLGLPLRLDAFAPGQRRGAHYAALTGGYLQSLGRLPDPMGGQIMGGAWIENGSAFDVLSEAEYEVQLGFGLIAETLLGPGWITFGFGPSARGVTLGFGSLFQ